jgi:hypothetical protein
VCQRNGSCCSGLPLPFDFFYFPYFAVEKKRIGQEVPAPLAAPGVLQNIKFNTHDEILEHPGALKVKIFDSKMT